jgi:hypothetical protein
MALQKIIIFIGILIWCNFVYAQNQPHLLDIRDCKDLSCSSNNLNIQSVFLSNAAGVPISDNMKTCELGSPQVAYISFTYTTNSHFYQARLFADLDVGDTQIFINYYFGEILSGSGSRTLTGLPITWVCGDELNLTNALIALKTNNSHDLSESYACGSYPGGQCKLDGNRTVESPLAVQFDFEVGCNEDGNTQVVFTDETNGGVPSYTYQWTFVFGEVTETSTIANPVLVFTESGSATLRVTDANGTTNTFSTVIVVKDPMTISGVKSPVTAENKSDGAVSLTVDGGVAPYQYSWSGPDGFSSTNQNLSGLSGGTYQVVVTDANNCEVFMTFYVDTFTEVPVKWSFLKGFYAPASKTVKLNWEVTKEWDNSHFEVYRSADGVADFVLIGKVKGNGFSDVVSNYYFEDNFLPLGKSRLFYRIRQVDKDGKYSYTHTIRVDATADQVSTWKSMPNPIQGNSWKILAGEGAQNEPVLVKIFASQKVVYQIALPYAPILDLSTAIPHLPKGLLLVMVQSGNQSSMLKLLNH